MSAEQEEISEAEQELDQFISSCIKDDMKIKKEKELDSKIKNIPIKENNVNNKNIINIRKYNLSAQFEFTCKVNKMKNYFTDLKCECKRNIICLLLVNVVEYISLGYLYTQNWLTHYINKKI